MEFNYSQIRRQAWQHVKNNRSLIVFLASTLEVLRLTIPSDIVLVVGLMFIHPYWNAARALMYKQLQQIKAADEAIETPCQVVNAE